MLYLKPNPYLHVLLQPMDRQKVEMSLVLSSGGSWFENESNRGQKHLLEHCILSHTQSMSFQQLKDFSFRENIYLNASTSPLTMAFQSSGHHSNFREILDLLLYFAFEPNLVQEDLDREKEIVLREISERRGDPSYQLYYQTVKEVYTPESLENHEVLGSSVRVSQTTLEDFRQLYRQSLRNSHMILNIAGGGVDLEYLQSKLSSYLEQGTDLIQAHNDTGQKLNIDFYPNGKLNNFKFLPYVNPLAHAHAEVSLFIPTEVNFANRPNRKILESLYLRYGGILYDRLRDELGLVYSLSSYFSKDLQHLVIEFSCEINLITQIIAQTKEVFSNFQSSFKPHKFHDFKHLLSKRQDLVRDSLGAEINHTYTMLRTHGEFETFDQYSEKLREIEVDQFKQLYDQITLGLDNMRVVVVSKNPEIEKLIV